MTKRPRHQETWTGTMRYWYQLAWAAVTFGGIGARLFYLAATRHPAYALLGFASLALGAATTGLLRHQGRSYGRPGSCQATPN